MPYTVDSESETGDSVVILRSDPGETVGMTRDRAYFLAQSLRTTKDKDRRELNRSIASSRMWVWQTSVGCEYNLLGRIGGSS